MEEEEEEEEVPAEEPPLLLPLLRENAKETPRSSADGGSAVLQVVMMMIRSEVGSLLKTIERVSLQCSALLYSTLRTVSFVVIAQVVDSRESVYRTLSLSTCCTVQH